METKVDEWIGFSNLVVDHIGDYVLPQYGDYPDKTIANFTPVKIQAKLEAYVGRIGRSSRGTEDAKRDCLKIAHFACYLYQCLNRE